MENYIYNRGKLFSFSKFKTNDVLIRFIRHAVDITDLSLCKRFFNEYDFLPCLGDEQIKNDLLAV